MKIRRLLPFGALVLLATGCGMLRVNIKTNSSGGSGGSESGGQAAGSADGSNAFTGADSRTVKVKLDNKGAPNPKLTKMTVLATMNPKKAGYECGFGDYVSAAPNALVTIAPGAENVVIKPRSSVDGILLSRDGKFFCATDGKSLKPNGLTAGTYELRVLLDSTKAKKSVPGKGYQPTERDVVLSFGDPTRGPVYDKSVKHVALEEAPQRPLFVTGKTPKGEGFRYGDSRCRATYGPMPHAVFSSERPVGNIKFLRLWSPKPVELRMQKLPKDEGAAPKSEGWCSDDWPSIASAGNLDGRVAIHIGNRGEGGGGRDFGYVVLSNDTVVDPYEVSPVPLPDKLDIADRQLTYHFPFISDFFWQRPKHKFTEKSPWRNGSETDKARQRLFMEAPKQLFVTPKYDLDKNSTRSKGGDFPKKGETLLLYEAKKNSKYVTVFRADGSQWMVLKDAIVHPDGFSVPATTTRKFTPKSAWGQSGPEDEALIENVRDEEKKYKKCFESRTAAADRQIDAINDTSLHWTRYNKRKKKRIWDAAASAARRSCGKAKLEKLKEKTNQDLVAARTQRINERLAQIAERLKSL